MRLIIAFLLVIPTHIFAQEILEDGVWGETCDDFEEMPIDGVGPNRPLNIVNAMAVVMGRELINQGEAQKEKDVYDWIDRAMRQVCQRHPDLAIHEQVGILMRDFWDS